MIIYSTTNAQFIEDVMQNRIDQVVLDQFVKKLHRPGDSEIRSWRNSLRLMKDVMEVADTPSDAMVAIEYQVPQTSKRVDFLVSGVDESGRDSLVIVELKQWEKAAATRKDAVVESYIGRRIKELPHPSYQAWTYAALIRDFNVEVQNSGITLNPCAYLHNCRDGRELKSEFYKEHTRRAPIFIQSDVERLAAFLNKHVKKGDRNEVLYRIENSEIRPSKELANHLVSLIKGNREFVMIDDQKLVYEAALEASECATSRKKQVLLVEGGPGTGKSVIAINLLVELTNREKTAQYVTKNAAPKEVYQAKLAGTLTKTRISNLFKGSASYVNSETNSMDCLIVDEAHRLEKTSIFDQRRGDNQIKELINARKQLSSF